MAGFTILLQLLYLKVIRTISLAALPASNPGTIGSHLSPLHLLSFCSGEGRHCFLPSFNWPCAHKLTRNHFCCQLLILCFNLLCLWFIKASPHPTAYLRTELPQKLEYISRRAPNTPHFVFAQQWEPGTWRITKSCRSRKGEQEVICFFLSRSRNS